MRRGRNYVETRCTTRPETYCRNESYPKWGPRHTLEIRYAQLVIAAGRNRSGDCNDRPQNGTVALD